MRGRHTQKLTVGLALLVSCVAFGQSPVGGLLVPIKNTYGSTVYRGQVVIADSTSTALAGPYLSSMAKQNAPVYALKDTASMSAAYIAAPGFPPASVDSQSVTMWVWFAGGAGSYPCMIRQEGTWWIRLVGTTTTVSMTKDWASEFGTHSITDSAWHFIAGTWEKGAYSKLYIDGVVTDSGVTINTLPGGASTFIGTSVGAEAWRGYIDEVHYYTNILTASQISTAYNSGAGVYGLAGETGLWGGWHFDEGTGTQIYDYSGNGHTGGIQFIPWAAGYVQSPYVVGSPVLYSVGTVYSDSITNGALGFMTSAGAGYVALQKPTSSTAIPGDRILVVGDSVGLADCQTTASVTDHFREIGQPLTKPMAKNARGDSVLIADIHKN